MKKQAFTQQQRQEIKQIVREALGEHLHSLEPKIRLEGASAFAAAELIDMVYQEGIKDSTKLKAIEIILEAAGVIERRGRRKFSRKASGAVNPRVQALSQELSQYQTPASNN